MAKFSFLLFNWVHWAILYSKVMHISYSLISAPSDLPISLLVNPFASPFPLVLFPKVESYSVKLGGRSPCRSELLPDPYSRYSWLLSSPQSPSSSVACPGSLSVSCCLSASPMCLIPSAEWDCVHVTGVFQRTWDLCHLSAIILLLLLSQKTSKEHLNMNENCQMEGVPGVCLEMGAPILKALCPGLHLFCLTFQALIGKADSMAGGLPRTPGVLGPSPHQCFSSLPVQPRHDLSYTRCL